MANQVEDVSQNGDLSLKNNINHGFEKQETALNGDDDENSHTISPTPPAKRLCDVDEMIEIVGEYGFYQKIANIMLCLMSIPTCFHLTIIYFLADRPSWKCTADSKVCLSNATFDSSDTSRCDYNRHDWTYTVPKDYSLQTQFDIVCEREWLISISTTMFFTFWIMGAIAMGWVADNYGRRFALFISFTVVMVVTFISAFMPNFYLFIACRAVVGFFAPGTFPQMFILISEIVGEKQRSFAGISIFLCSAVSAMVLCLKAYYIRHWGMLSIACSAPYLVMLLFYFFLPESIRFLRVRGRMEEAIMYLHKIAKWNKKTISSDVTLSALDSSVFEAHAHPTDLFRTRRLALSTLVQMFTWLACGMTYVGLYSAAADLDGDIYRDYILMAAGEAVGIIVIMDLVERIGRKPSVMGSMVLGAALCLALGPIPKYGHYMIVRLVFGMAGKAALASSFDALHTWSVELYPAKYRGEAMGIMQVATRIGTASSPWVTKELKSVHKNASFFTMGLVSLIAFFVMFYLPETKGVKTEDVDEELEKKLRLDRKNKKGGTFSDGTEVV